MTISMIIIISESALKTVKVRQSSDPWERELHVQKGHVPSTWAQQGLSNGFCVTIPVLHTFAFLKVFLDNFWSASDDEAFFMKTKPRNNVSLKQNCEFPVNKSS